MVKEAGKGRRAEYAEQTRQAILEAARELFVEQGYFATKVDEIARTARVARPRSTRSAAARAVCCGPCC